MQRILIVKTSSLGDVVHNLPIVTDMHRFFEPAELIVDWVVEEAYAELPAMHPGVSRVLPVALRRWRTDWFGATVKAERAAFRQKVCEVAYDAVLDTQGLLKSALLARSARLVDGGLRIGANWRGAREPLASLFYNRRMAVDAGLHAVERLRSLAASGLDYPVVGGPDFGLQVPQRTFDWLPHPAYAVMLHATSRAEKSWPADRWVTLGRRLAASNIVPVFVWGSPGEEVVARELAAQISDAIVPPRMRLSELAALLDGARVVVGVDTGLTHLAAALGSRVVALFGATPRWRFAPYWNPIAVSLGDDGVQPALAEVAASLQGLGVL
jgi:heptosyltransferase I